jgi:hypothetical protein
LNLLDFLHPSQHLVSFNGLNLKVNPLILRQYDWGERFENSVLRYCVNLAHRGPQ